MRKIISILLFCTLLLAVGCSSPDTTLDGTDSKNKVRINMPTDDTVGGYRTEKNYSMATSIESGSVSSESQGTKTTAVFYGNKNTHVFHTANCPSAIKMKDSNRVPFSTREEAIAAGYTPCKRCNP